MEHTKQVIVVKEGDPCPNCSGTVERKKPIFSWLTPYLFCDECKSEWDVNGE